MQAHQSVDSEHIALAAHHVTTGRMTLRSTQCRFESAQVAKRSVSPQVYKGARLPSFVAKVAIKHDIDSIQNTKLALCYLHYQL